MTLASLLAHLATPDALSTQAVLALLTALGLSSTAGFRAYLPLLAVAIGSNVDSSALPLQQNFQSLKSPPLMIILGVLVVLEFVVDKVPVLDHLSDVVHTVIRPISGAIIMAATQNTISDINPWLAAAVGAVLALLFHSAKATTRPAVSVTTAGAGNPVVSTIEDILVIVASVLLIAAPIIGIILVAVLALLLLRLALAVVRRVRGRGAAGRKGRGTVIVPSVTGGTQGGTVQPTYTSAMSNPSSGAASPTRTTVPATYQPPSGATPPVYPTPVLQMPTVQPQGPTQPYVPPGAYPGDATTLPGKLH